MCRLGFVLVLSVLFVFVGKMSGQATERVLIPVPKNVIYAGQRISVALLRDRSVPAEYLGRVSVFTMSSEVLGKIARTTLMPNRPIPTNYVIEPNVVHVNRKTVMRFEQDGLTIVAEVVSLNNAKAGEAVRARNINSGIVVYGTANVDGTITALGVR
ncbi:MAG: flagellar basal body P-ring formation chaperone FlgA [Pseudomonadota bacterium]